MLIGRLPVNSSLGGQATHTRVNLKSISFVIDNSDALQVYRCAGTSEYVLAIEAVNNRGVGKASRWLREVPKANLSPWSQAVGSIGHSASGLPCRAILW